MKLKPILFSTLMVQAILAGRKTMTRRIVKMPDLIKEPNLFRYIGNSNDMEICRKTIPYDDRLYHEWQRINSNAASWVIHSYKPGDILWVRETWNQLLFRYAYKADDKERDKLLKWKPSIFMPKEAARIFLEVTDVRVERLQDISEADAKSEGVIPFKAEHESEIDCWTDGKHKTAFNYLWNEINGWDPNSWESNPWVWVISFNQIEKPC